MNPSDIVRIVTEAQEKKRQEELAARRMALEEELKRQQLVREEAAKKSMNDVIDAIRAEIGNDFIDIKPALDQYSKELSSKLTACIDFYFDKKEALKGMFNLIDKELDTWHDEPWEILKSEFDVDYKEEAQNYLVSKAYAFLYACEPIFQDLLSHIYKEKNRDKQWMLTTIDELSFNECLELLKKFKNDVHELNHLYKQSTRHVSDDSKKIVKEYIEFYTHASLLVRHKLNELSWNKEKNTYIDEEEYNQALIYFYEKDSLEEIKNIIKRDTYLKNQNKGTRGEEVVDYALSWLSEEYVNIPQSSVGRYGQKCILIQNTAFRKETQEYDHIVVGPQGVFLIETKNFAGEITIDEDGNWTRRKDGQGVVGERSPLQQIRRHEKLMKSIVDDVNVVSIMCLSHPRVIVNGANNSPIKILKSDLLCDYIENYETDNKLSKEEIQAIADKIKSYMV